MRASLCTYNTTHHTSPPTCILILHQQTGVADQPVTLHPSSVYFIGQAFAQQLADQLNLPTSAVRISVGRDPRISGPMVTAALLAGRHISVCVCVQWCMDVPLCVLQCHTLFLGGHIHSFILGVVFTTGIASTGASATPFGLCTTPAMFMSCVLPGMLRHHMHIATIGEQVFVSTW